ncbi:hypothetical protein [Deinococcus altitudinis]|uniref:hypothetical protein n=1 Tax=Deinococcus altitudinis TaxID=468914 RepID=UPI003891E530
MPDQPNAIREREGAQHGHSAETWLVVVCPQENSGGHHDKADDQEFYGRSVTLGLTHHETTSMPIY